MKHFAYCISNNTSAIAENINSSWHSTNTLIMISTNKKDDLYVPVKLQGMFDWCYQGCIIGEN